MMNMKPMLEGFTYFGMPGGRIELDGFIIWLTKRIISWKVDRLSQAGRTSHQFCDQCHD